MKTSQIFYLLLLIMVSYSCSNDLSRDNAAKIILDNLEPEHQSLTIKFWKHNANFLPGGYGYTATLDGNAQSALIAHGFITHVGPSRLTHYHLSNRLMQYEIIDETPRYVTTVIEVANIDGVEVTGIAGENDVRQVECVIIYKPNEVGTVMLSDNDLRKQMSFTFQKYDDGWRLKPVSRW